MDKRKSLYRRANETFKRSVFWKNVFDLNSGVIKVDILCECENETFANEKEKEFISIYGRKNTNTGTLVNLTDGGDGSQGLVYTKEMKENLMKRIKENSPRLGKTHSEKTKLVLSERAKKRTNVNPFKGKKHTQENIDNFKLLAQNRNPTHTKKVIDVLSGKIFNKVKDAAVEIGMNYSNLCECLKGKRINKTTLKYYDGITL